MGLNNQHVYDEQQSGIDRFSGGGSQVFAVAVNVTIAQLNAGLTLIEGRIGYKVQVIGLHVNAVGTFTELTSITVTNTAGTSTIATYAVANLGNGARHSTLNTSTGQTVGSGFMAQQADGQGITIQKTGTAEATATSLNVILSFVLVKA
jgi:hypothetical protein